MLGPDEYPDGEQKQKCLLAAIFVTSEDWAYLNLWSSIRQPNFWGHTVLKLKNWPKTCFYLIFVN